jgi:hypothetical protein
VPDTHFLRPQALEAGKLQKKSYDFDSRDYFWAKNAANPFPQVAEDIDAELNRSVAPCCFQHLA